MRVICRSGHFAFYPRDQDEVGQFGFTYGQALTRDNDFYTFEALKGVPNYSIKDKAYAGITATETFEGETWDVFGANGFVYSLKEKKLVAKTSISIFVNPPEGAYFWVADVPLIQPGSQNKNGQRLLSYDAELSLQNFSLSVFGVEYE